MPPQTFPYPMMPDAQAVVHGSQLHPALYGVVFFCQMPYGVLINAQFRGLPLTPDKPLNPFLGFHIHENGDCTQNAAYDFSLTGSHYNPKALPHPAHSGDLPPILNCKGYAWQSFLTDTFSVAEVLGRSVIVHTLPDDFTTQPSGNSGAKIGCGIIVSNE